MDLQQAEELLKQAKVAYENNDIEKAIELLVQIERTSDNVKEAYARAQLSLGLLLKKQGHFEEAEKFLNKVNKKDSSERYAQAKFNLAILSEKQSRFDEAQKIYEHISPDDSSKYYAWAQWNMWCHSDEKIYLENILEKHDLETYAEARFVLGELEENLDSKNKYWQQISEDSQQYIKESYQINIVKTIVELENTTYKNVLFEVFENVGEILKALFINNKYEQFIAHYTNLNVSKLLLSNQKIDEKDIFKPISKLRLNTINLMNDPEEGLLVNKLLCLDSKITTQDSAFIACFTLHHDSLNQFRLYSKEGQQEACGLSLVLDNQFFSKEHNVARIYEKETKQNNQNNTETKQKALAAMPLYRCIYFDPTSGLINVAQREKWSFKREFKLEGTHHWYDENKQAEKKWKEYIYGKKDRNGGKLVEGIVDIEKKVLDGLKNLSRLIEKMNLDEFNLKQQALLAEILLPLRYLMKHMAFKEEQECRIVYVTKMENPLVKYHEEINRIYIDYEPSVMEHLEKIYLAPKAKDEKTFIEFLCAHGQTVRQHKVTKESNGRVQVKISQNPFQ